MAHESFEDEAVAEFLNEHFVSIKVDKEERPDVDSIYMSVCQNMTGSGGWPLTIFMFPDQKPFFAGTYFPKESRYNMPGFLELLEAVIEKWETDREELLKTSQGITNILKNESVKNTSDAEITKDMITNAARSLIRHFDKEYGGFGRAPKFPTPHNLLFLLRVAYHEKNPSALQVVEKTLDAMYRGGIFDHIGYGFSRYSTDSKWLVPHFEKMLYDNGLLVLAYLEAYQITKKEHYRQIAEMTMEYVLRELTHEEGGFYCAQDADSEGMEGKYYVFTPNEVTDILGKEDGKYFNKYFDISEDGNFEGKNIPNRIHAIKLGQMLSADKVSADKTSGDTGNNTGFFKKIENIFGNHNLQDMKNEGGNTGTISSNLLENERIVPLRERMYEYRVHRTKLHKDDKILTSWNGIMIAALAKAYQILRKEKYLVAAKKADEFLKKHLCKDNRLFVYYRNGERKGAGHLDDYAFYCWALLQLYEATLDLTYLERVREYTDVLIHKFFDMENGGFYLYAKDAENLIHRPKELYDGAIPSGNSVAAYVLIKLAHYTADAGLLEYSGKQLKFIAGGITEYPSAYCFSLMALMQFIYPTKEVVAVLPNEGYLNEMHLLLSEYFMPDVTILVKTEENQNRLKNISQFTGDYSTNHLNPSYYVCENHACQAPVHNIAELESLLIITE